MNTVDMSRRLSSHLLLAFPLMVVMAFPGRGQVEVANGSLENVIALPNASGQIDRTEAWQNGGSDMAMPDFYHENGTGGGDLPQTPLAKVNPYLGRAIAGFVAYTEESDPMHEYLTGAFSEPLRVGQRYRMSFAITSGRVHDWVEAGIGVSGLGVAMGMGVPEQDGYNALDLQPQFQIHESLYTRQWRTFQFVFTALEPFTHFTLGRFGSEIRIREEEEGDRTMAYYFVDAFTITPEDVDFEVDERPRRGPKPVLMPEGVFMPNAFTPNADEINDVWCPALTEDNLWTCTVANRWGEVIWQAEGLTDIQEGWRGLDANNAPCPNGVYAWSLRASEPVDEQVEWHGWVNLIR